MNQRCESDGTTRRRSRRGGPRQSDPGNTKRPGLISSPRQSNTQTRLHSPNRAERASRPPEMQHDPQRRVFASRRQQRLVKYRYRNLSMSCSRPVGKRFTGPDSTSFSSHVLTDILDNRDRRASIRRITQYSVGKPTQAKVRVLHGESRQTVTPWLGRVFSSDA